MERGSSKHSPRVDEQLEHEVQGMLKSGHETHAEEWKSGEPSGEDQPDVDRAPGETLTGGTPDGMTPDDVEGRSELAGYLGKEVWPADAEQLLALAAERQAPASVLDGLRKLPAGQPYENLQEVWSALGGGTEQHRS